MNHFTPVAVNYYNEGLKEKVLSLPRETLAEFIVLVDIIIECGADVNIPYIVVLGKDLYRSKLFNTNTYVYYVKSGKKEITIIHVSEKCDKLSNEFLTWLQARQLEVGSVESLT